MKTLTKFKNSPWGQVDGNYPIEGIAMAVTTPSHGGVIMDKEDFLSYVLSKEVELGKSLPMVRKYVENHTYSNNFVYFEEDCNWAVFCLITGIYSMGEGYVDTISEYRVKSTVKNWNQDISLEIFGEYVSPFKFARRYYKDDREFSIDYGLVGNYDTGFTIEITMYDSDNKVVNSGSVPHKFSTIEDAKVYYYQVSTESIVTSLFG